MHATSQNNPAPEGSSFPTRPKSKHPVLKKLLTLVGLCAVALIAYSFYVAFHEPDPQETVLLGQTAIASDSPAGLRVLVRHRASCTPVRGAEVVLNLTSKSSGPIKLGSFRTDANGTVADSINIPELAPGEYQLVVDVASSFGRDHIVRKVEVQHPLRILLSSDKPLYQPGQTIHLRSLISNARTQKPFTNDSVTFEVSDPKGNKVFKQTHQLSAFGIASADFVLASELNQGRYEVRALAGPATAERTVDVKRYVLPKFKINITTEKSYYLPGQTVSGSVQARYFFGKPVNFANVKLTTSALTVPDMAGHTDANGFYLFHFTLPDAFAGLPENSEQASLDLDAEVTDSGQHAEQKMLSLSIAKNELSLTAIPEAGVIVPGVENLVYALTTYPDGRPAVCRVFVDGTAYQSDAQGVSVIKLSPADTARQIELQAQDDSGHRAKFIFKPENKSASPTLLTRTDKAVYQAGESVQLTLLSPENDNTVFIDVIKEGQTVLTKSVPLKNHRAQYSLPLPPAFVGALKLNTYLISATGEDCGRSRLIYVNPASALQIKSQMSKPIFRPGEIAKVEFSVVDAQGKPAPSALGISAVDESVFALSENRPGLLQQFLDTEADLLKPRYQIKSFCDPGQFLTRTSGNQGLAQAYFSSWTETPDPSSIDDLSKTDESLPRILAHIRSLRGTPDYESLRNNPQYSALLRQVEGEDRGTYTLREATGPIKLAAVEAERRAYFGSLKKYLGMALCVSIFLLPIGLIIFYLVPHVTEQFQTDGARENARYVSLASASYHLLAALTLCPLIFYPLGFMYLDRRRGGENSGWILLTLETVVVLFTLLLQSRSISKAKKQGLTPEITSLQTALGIFFAQFFLSRAGFVSLVFIEPQAVGGLALFLLLVSLIAPLVVLAGLAANIRGRFAAKGIFHKLERVSVLEILVIIAMMALLAGLLLPALASAKAKAVRINLMSDLKQIEIAKHLAEDDDAKSASPSGTPAAPRVRREFPETLLWRPELITDDQGKATLEIPLADSITTWRASVDAVNASGRMGSTQLPITVFQDFFVDLDLPTLMSLDDEVSVPVTCYNYLKTPQDIRLQLAPASWFECSESNQTVTLASDEVKCARFPIRVRGVGNHILHVTAQGPKIADAIEREILVVPTGNRIEYTKNETLQDQFTDTFPIPNGTIPGSESLWIKFYPSRYSEVVEGLDSIFEAPHGCFEQTSSTTYPNVLVLDYLKRTGRLTPEVEVKAHKYINEGYQRLISFEVPGGGFEWFGHTPAHVGLTAYGILEFVDMSRAHPVDPALIERTSKWLESVQNSDGSWSQTRGYDEWAASSPVTAYVAWALAESGDQSAALDRALNYLRDHVGGSSTTYEKALIANAFLARDRNDTFGRSLINQLQKVGVRGDDGKSLYWISVGHNTTFSCGTELGIQTTALCSMAMMKARLWPESVKESLTWISKRKSAKGTWGSTQTTILAMRALLAGSSTPLGQDFESTITLLLNGEKIETVKINKDNSDVMQQFDLAKYLHTGENHIELRQSPTGELPFQLTGACWLPAATNTGGDLTTRLGKTEPLQIDLHYDRTTFAVNDQVACAVTVKNNTSAKINMAMVDLGIPPGFDIDPAAFESMRESQQIAKFETTGNQVILYLRDLSESEPMRFTYSLRAKYPLRVQTPPSIVYEYYQPANRAESKAVTLQVSGAK